MKKQLTNTTNYEPNTAVKIKVVNKPLVDAETGEQFGYDTKLTMTFKVGVRGNQLTFATVDEIAEFMANIDYDEPQQSLPLGSVTKK